MKISGHKSLRDFYRYIRITPEEGAQKIREIWQQRGDIAAPPIPDRILHLSNGLFAP